MKKSIFFIGVDVDDKTFHGCGINKETGETIEFVTRPTAGHLANKLLEIQEKGFDVKICYEATYLGFSLQRELSKKGFDCEVIAPSLIPRKSGQVIKTDRIDCRDMAVYYVNGQLTKVYIPSEEEESIRSIVRTRRFLSDQQSSLKRYILSTCRQIGLNYRESSQEKKLHYWTNIHRSWLAREIKKEKFRGYEFNINMLLSQLDNLEQQIRLYEIKIEEIAESEFYREKVQSLRCYRGIELLTAMTLISELHDIRRFSHPTQLCSYAGMDLREYSSGGHERRYHMSKMGNKHIRTSVVEACQQAWKTPQIGKVLRARRKNTDEKYIKIADRCMERLYKKSGRLLRSGKTQNKVKVACAREMLCFVWESLHAANV